jgi:cellulose synthase/poly-beta-1,6-N-acetylglucosamine synthase-like glycosyltransferase
MPKITLSLSLLFIVSTKIGIIDKENNLSFIMSFLLFVFATIIVSYVVFFATLLFSLKKSRDESMPYAHAEKISIIIPFRNESDCIINCLNSLKKQEYNSSFLEVILVNDHSEDDSLIKADSFILQNNLQNNYKTFSLPKNEQGKKAALNLGIQKAQGEIIITSDADCTFNSKWVEQIMSAFRPNTHFVFGPVTYNNEKGFLQYFFSLEFLSMVLAGITMAKLKMPVYCNAANMAFRKSSYLKIINKISGSESVSGDDVFTLHAFIKSYPQGIIALNNFEAMVSTTVPKTLQEAISQRLRWASKSRYYKNVHIRLMMYLIGVTNLIILFMLVIGIFNPNRMWVCLIIFAIKCGIDYSFLHLGTKQMKKTKLLRVFLPAEIIYPIYLFVLFFLNYTIPLNWKGRKI